MSKENIKPFHSSVILFVLCLFNMSTYGQYDVGEVYFGTNDYVEYRAGNLPIIIVAPHAGTLTPIDLPDVDDRGPDNGTLETTLDLWDSLFAQTNGCYPHIIINHLHPNKMNPTDEIDTAAGEHPNTRLAYEEFHGFIEAAKIEVVDEWGTGHYFEMHGNGHDEMWNEIGLGVSGLYLNDSDEAILERLELSTVKNLCTVGGSDFLEIIKGATSLGGLLDARGWDSVPSPSNPSPGDGGFFFAGWNTWLHGSRYEGTIDATHLENYYVFMQVANRAEYTHDLAESILIFMNEHYGFELDCSDLGVDVEKDNQEFKIYPNPANASNVFQINSAKVIDEIIVYDLLGAKVDFKFDESTGSLKIYKGTGTFIIQIRLENGQLIAEKVSLVE